MGILPYKSTTPMKDQLISGAPNELAFEVFKFLDFRTLAALCCVNRKLLNQVSLFLPYVTLAGIKEIKQMVASLADSDKKDFLVLEIVRLEMKNALKDAFATALIIKNPELRIQTVMEIFSAVAAKDLLNAKIQAQRLDDLQLRDSALVGIVKVEATKDLNAAKKTASIIKDKSLRNEAYIEIVKVEAAINLKDARKTAKTLDDSIEEYSNSRGSRLSPQKRALLEVIKVEATKDLAAAKKRANAYRTAAKNIAQKPLVMGDLAGNRKQQEMSDFSDLAFIEIIKVEATKDLASAKETRSSISQGMWGKALLEIIKVEVSKDLNAARATHRFMNTTMPENNQALLEIVKEMAKINTEEAFKIISSMTPHVEFNNDAFKEYQKYHSAALFEFHKATVRQNLVMNKKIIAENFSRLSGAIRAIVVVEAESNIDSAKEYVMNIKNLDLKDELLIEIIKKEAALYPLRAKSTAAEIIDPAKQAEAYIQIAKLVKMPKIPFSVAPKVA